uniref:Uncharacterized protein n=1 Tax=Rhizophora mucronata TaxID=61149 RepID=A0A2P2JZ99_RHIMU
MPKAAMCLAITRKTTNFTCLNRQKHKQKEKLARSSQSQGT